MLVSFVPEIINGRFRRHARAVGWRPFHQSKSGRPMSGGRTPAGKGMNGKQTVCAATPTLTPRRSRLLR